MKTRIIRIGNSQGIRIPKAILDQCGISGDVDIAAEDNHILIRSLSHPRDGWDRAFRKMAEKHDDALADGDESLSHVWDEREWQW